MMAKRAETTRGRISCPARVPRAPAGLWVLVGAVCLLWPAVSRSAVPSTVAIEGRLLTAQGAPVADGQYAVTFSLYGSEGAKQAAWSETAAALAVKAGTFRHALGSVKPLGAAVLSAGKGLWLGLRVGNEPELARSRIHAVPFALRAALAESIACTGCVSLAALKPDGDLDLGGHALKAKQLTAGLVQAGTITAQSFAGDGSKLTGIKLPSGACPKGQAVVGILSDGKLKCGAVGLGAGKLEEVSGGQLTTKYAASIASTTTPLAIDDNNPIGAFDVIDVPDIGKVKELTITVKLTNSDISGIELIVYDPTNAPYTLYKGGGKGKVLDETWPVTAKPLSGDLATWKGKNPKGKWRLRVIDTKFLSNGKDGAVSHWSINLLAAASNRVTSLGLFVAKGGFSLPSAKGPSFACTLKGLGYVYVDSGDKRLYYCDGSDWRKVLIEPLCGNKVVNGGETCDDGNLVDGDGCTSKCQKNICGDGVLYKGVEECDDGNKNDNDECSSKCKLLASKIACADGTAEQQFSAVMFGCNGSYTSLNIETACAKGWHPANPNEYFSYGGKTVKPNQLRWVDTAWDAQGKDTSIKNWQGYYDSSNGSGWNSLSKNSNCTWLSSSEQCYLSFSNHDYGKSYGCHCRGGNPKITKRGVICVKNSAAKPRL